MNRIVTSFRSVYLCLCHFYLTTCVYTGALPYPVAVLGTSKSGSRPGRHLFMTHGGWHGHFICTEKRFSIIYHITVWGIGILAPPAAVVQASLLAEKVPCTEAVWEGGKGWGAQGTVHLWVSQMERTFDANRLHGLKSLLKPAGLCDKHTEERDHWAALPQHCMTH